MTNREELAGRLDLRRERLTLRPGELATYCPLDAELDREAAAALRQSPSVEEVARVIDPAAWDKFDHMIGKTYAGWIPMDQRREEQKELVASSLAKAAEIDRLYRGSKE